MSLIATHMPLLARHAGLWIGQYRHVRPDGTLIDQHGFRIDVSFPGVEGATYRQVSHYVWADGRTRDLAFEGVLSLAGAQPEIIFDNGRIKGRLWAADPTTLMLRFGYAAEPEMDISEILQLSDDGLDRARVWQWRRKGRLERITLVDEARG